MMYTKPAKSKRIIRSNYRAMHGPLMVQDGELTISGSALVSLEFIGIFLLLDCKIIAIIGDFLRWTNFTIFNLLLGLHAKVCFY